MGDASNPELAESLSGIRSDPKTTQAGTKRPACPKRPSFDCVWNSLKCLLNPWNPLGSTNPLDTTLNDESGVYSLRCQKKSQINS